MAYIFAACEYQATFIGTETQNAATPPVLRSTIFTAMDSSAIHWSSLTCPCCAFLAKSGDPDQVDSVYKNAAIDHLAIVANQTGEQ